MEKIKVLIVEDNYFGQELIARMLKEYCPTVEIVGVSENINDSILLINEFDPQLVILDIRLKDENGFDLFKKIKIFQFETIVISAYPEFALDGYKYNILDYLIKPFEPEDFIKAINKCNRRLDEKSAYQLHNVLTDAYQQTNIKKNLTIESLTKTNVINFEDIMYCESDGRYTSLFLKDNNKIVASKNLGKIEQLLDDKSFFRIHHSYLVNIRYIVELVKKHNYFCLMKNSIMLPVAERRKISLKHYLQNHL